MGRGGYYLVTEGGAPAVEEVGYVRVRGPGGQRTVEKPRFLGGAFS